MVSTEEVALSLRLGQHRRPAQPPALSDFVRPRPRTSTEPLAVIPGACPQPPSGPVMLFFQHADYGIPDPDAPAPALPDLRCWSIRPTTFGYLAKVPRERPAHRRSRVAWVVAACLPLVALPTTAAAAPGSDRPAVQRPEPAVPEPGSTADSGDDASAAPAPADEPSPGVRPPLDPQPEVDSDYDVFKPPPPPSAAGLDFEGAVRTSEQALLDAAWEGVDGFEVELELKGGKTLRGRVGAVQRETFTLIDSKDGSVLVLPKNGVISLRAHVPPVLPTKTGTGLLAGGGVLTGTGTPVFVAGVAILGLCPSCVSINLPLLLVGGAALGAGIPLLVRGTQRRQEYQRVLNERLMAPVIARTPHGWTGGIRFRF